MNILIIEDNKSKYKNLEDTLNRVVDSPSITWEQSRNNGLVAIKEHNFINDNELVPFDMLICDNYLPIYDDDWETKPFGQDIVEEVRERFELTDLPIVMCSSEDVGEFDYNYKIRYDSSVIMDEMFKMIIDDINDKKILTKQEKDDIFELVKLCDGIILQGGATSSNYEIEYAKKAIEAGKHVLSEKQLSFTKKESEILYTTCGS